MTLCTSCPVSLVSPFFPRSQLAFIFPRKPARYNFQYIFIVLPAGYFIAPPRFFVGPGNIGAHLHTTVTEMFNFDFCN